jgi:hypothetical protein
MKIQDFFYFCGSFLSSWIRIRIRNLNEDPDPATQINADPDTDPDPKPCYKVCEKYKSLQLQVLMSTFLEPSMKILSGCIQCHSGQIHRRVSSPHQRDVQLCQAHSSTLALVSFCKYYGKKKITPYRFCKVMLVA